MRNTRCFEVTYLPCTNYLPSRVKIKDIRFKKSKIIDYDHSLNNIFDMAYNFLKSKNIECEHMGESEKGYLLFSYNFSDQIK